MTTDKKQHDHALPAIGKEVYVAIMRLNFFE